MAEFARAFEDADTVRGAGYLCGERGADCGGEAEALVKDDSGREWRGGVCGSMAEGVAALVREAKDGDVILTLGAGSVSQAGAAVAGGAGGVGTAADLRG